MKKHFSLLIVLVLLLTVVTACGKANRSGDDNSESEELQVITDYVEDSNIPQPFFVLDKGEDIRPLVIPYSRYIGTLLNDQSYGEVLYSDFLLGINVVTINGQQGLIDYSGNFIVPPVYESIYFPDIYYYTGDKEIWCVKDSPYGECDYLDSNYSLTSGSGKGSGGFGAIWLWDTVTQQPVLASMDEAYTSINFIQPDALVPVEIVTINYSVIDKYEEQGTTWYEVFTGDVGVNWVNSTGEMGYAIGSNLVITDHFNQAQVHQQGIAAVRISGSWFYINEAGVKISDVGYDDVYRFDSGYDEWLISFRSQNQYAYDFSEGLVAVNRGGRWGYMNKNGVEVIPCQYEATRPVYKGNAWIKQNGQWGIVDVSDYVS